MAVAGQPKSTAEYIQATSRVGRNTPGLVCTVYNWARPRDLSHYEQFEHYHATFYQYVEALSVTPFAARALDRGLSAVLVSLIRLADEKFNANSSAAEMEKGHDIVRSAVDAVAQRAALVRNSKGAGDEVSKVIKSRLDIWSHQTASMGGEVLGYDRQRDGLTRPLLRRPSPEPWEDFTCLNSLRDVEPEVNLVLNETGALGRDDRHAPDSGDESQKPDGAEE